HVKNIVGAFYHPDKVFIDLDTLSTLPERHIVSGLVEALKAGLIHDASLFEIFKKKDYRKHLEDIIYKSLCMKKWVVENDEKEAGLRKTLNFGHTIGHGIEAYYNLETYYHGECVAMGMLYFIEDDNLRQEVIQILKQMHVPYQAKLDNDHVFDIIALDKKAHGDMISIVKVKTAGNAYIEDIKLEQIKDILERGSI
ncbi:3-dehydroquinate synthase, partial [Breznakia sp. OttesenSCG-928-G09]|nr:3-dehydroquinate synthase [Breznakia sp. OttesenSCG-928-G09]